MNENSDAKPNVDLTGIIDSFDRVSVLVVGDVMLDRYWWGTVNRISPEAPVPVVGLERSTLSAGGAANVAANVAGMMARAVLVGLVGNDEGGLELPNVLRSVGVAPDELCTIEGRATTVKTRIVAHSQHIVRIDHEDVTAISEEWASQLSERICSLLANVNVLVLSDYAKGTLSPALLKRVIAEAKGAGIPILVDPKGKDYSRYDGATLITPNRFEAADVCGLEPSEAGSTDRAGAKLLSDLNIDACLITQGEDGMTLFRRDRAPLHLDAMARDVYDVTGAGDTVISTLGVALGAGADLEMAATLANMAAGVAVEQVGTTIVTSELLRKTVAESIYDLSHASDRNDRAAADRLAASSEVTHA